MQLIPGYSHGTWNENIFSCQTNHNSVDSTPHRLCYLFSNEWLSHRSSCNPINNPNFITPVALTLGRCQSEGLWVISYVNESNLRRAALPRSLLKGKLRDAVLSRCFRSAVLASALSNACQPNVLQNMLLIPLPRYAVYPTPSTFWPSI